jgi:hypothetical protein
MKLSKLIGYLTQLEDFKLVSAQDAARATLEPTLHYIQHQDIPVSLSDTLANDYKDIHNNILKFYSTVEGVKSELRSRVAEDQNQYLANSYQLYENQLQNDSVETILNRRFTPSDEVMNLLSSRIGQRSNWKWPGMIIRPGHNDWIHTLVGLDPLYLVDTDQDLMSPCDDKFTAEYLARLRKYIISETSSGNMLDALPSKQFGFILAYNYFNHKPIEIIKKYLQELFTKLRPGGVIGFTFNDCDRPGGVDLCERSFACYTPQSMLLGFAEDLGFELVYRLEIDAAITWMELAKPGQLSGLRGGQALARIVAKN